MDQNALNYESFSAWRQFYFIGISRNEPSSVSLYQDQLQALFEVANAPAVISCSALLDPRLIINQKGSTVWTALFVMPYMNDRLALEATARGKSSLQISPVSMRSAFGGHVNWPEPILTKHPIELKSGYLFILPFLMYRELPAPTAFSRSVKTPDGSVEVLRFEEFDDSNPEGMMKLLSEMCVAANRSWTITIPNWGNTSNWSGPELKR